MAIFINTTQDREMTFVSLVPEEDGVIGRQLTLALIYGTGDWTPH